MAKPANIRVMETLTKPQVIELARQQHSAFLRACAEMGVTVNLLYDKERK